MNPDEYDELLDLARRAKVQYVRDMATASKSALALARLLDELDEEDSRIAQTVLSRMTAAGATLSTAGSE